MNIIVCSSKQLVIKTKQKNKNLASDETSTCMQLACECSQKLLLCEKESRGDAFENTTITKFSDLQEAEKLLEIDMWNWKFIGPQFEEEKNDKAEIPVINENIARIKYVYNKQHLIIFTCRYDIKDI